jgi:amino acid adenylation domain-containing protein/thioester reductase-like protein
MSAMSLKNIEDVYPLSPMQQGMVFHSLYAPESSVYIAQMSFELRGVLNVAAFVRAWQQVIKRHPILRSACVWENLEKPLQIVGREVKFPWQEQDWRQITATEKQKKLQFVLQQDRQQGFELSNAPLMRLMLIRLQEKVYHFTWNYHHILLDGWSVAIIFKEVIAYYQAFCQGEEIYLEIPRPYRDYIGWLQQQKLQQAEDFWRQKLKGFNAPTPVGINQTEWRSLNQKEGYEEQEIKLSTITTTALQSLAKQHQLTLNTILQGAWALLLSRYSGEQDVVFGATVSGRPPTLVKSEGMVGLFINTLPVRVQINSEQFLIPWLKQLLYQQVEACQYEYTPLVEIQKWSDVTPGIALFQSIVVFENFPVEATLEEHGLNLEIQILPGFDKTNYPLTLSVVPGEELLLKIAYEEGGCFDAFNTQRMLQHLEALLKAMVANPKQSLKNLSLLTEAEQHQLLVEWNDTETEYPLDQCIHQIFEATVERTPDAVALVFEDQQLTYQELNYRANQLAHYLRKLGVRPEVIVAICVERSLDLVIGLLAILKAGGAYVPLDPSYPSERLALMLEDAKPLVLLTQARLVTLPLHAAKVVKIDTYIPNNISHASVHNAGQIQSNLISNLISVTTPENLAYIIYTSGSTGQAKGVGVQHNSLVNAYFAWEKTYQLRKDVTCHLQMASFSFDVFSGDLLRALCSGGKLVLCPRELLLSPKELYNLMVTEKVDCAEFVPVVLRNLMQYLEESQQCLDFMKLLICGSDVWYREEYQKFYKFCGSQTRLINSFGLTEATIDSSWFETTASELPNDQIVPIGRPFTNTKLYILDTNLQPVPIGVPGELYIGGASLARGYLNRPDFTAEKFIPNPYSNEPGLRLYKTGDLARYLPDGNIEYIGRIDYQVKLRGFRIELGEIEAVISQSPSVCGSVVVVREDETGNKNLVAYITLHPEQTLKIPELRRFLESKLPDYMVPKAFVMLEALPLTPNGKIDRRALPAPDLNQLIPISNFVAPSNPVEEMLAGIWAELLGIEKVGVCDNFFELGGHSLLATRVRTRIRQVFGVELPLRRLFEAPTVAEFAKDIEKVSKAGLKLEIPPIKPISRSLNLPLSFAQQRLWFLAQLEPDNPFYNIPDAIRLRGQLNIAALEQSFQEILRRHESLRTNFKTVEGQPVAVISSVIPQLLSVINLLELHKALQETTVKEMALAEAQQPFNLETDTLLRVKLLILNEQEYVALLTMHHIVSDAWSIDVLLREVATLYQAFCGEQPSPLAELPIQYADFAAWQRQWLQGEVLESQLSYWHQQLHGAPDVLELPTDNPRPAVITFRGATHHFQLSPEQSRALKTLSQQQGSTLFMTLLAAFKVLLHRYTGSSDIVVGSPIANRNHSEIEELIGFFVNTLVLRTDLGDNPSFQELLSRVREVTLGAYAHQDLPFEQLVEKLQPQRDLSHTPLFQVMFVLRDAQRSNIELPGLTFSSIESDSGTAKFDLTLYITESPSQLTGTLEYNTDLFEADTIQRMAGHLQTLLSGIVSDPKQRLSELPLLTQAEQHQLLVQWNDTKTEYSKHQCIHQIFETQVEHTPDAVALVFEDQQLTYQELNRRANQLAHYLRKLGVRPEVIVGICVERSLDLVVGLLGILKAGGAYLPLDPSYPQERLAFMLENSQTPILLSQQHLIERQQNFKTKLVCLDDWQPIALESSENLACNLAPDNLAYVIYTSGSTGRPKGTMNTHKGICNRLLWMQETYHLTAADCVLQKTPFSFDVSVWEFFWPLLAGARLAIARPDGHRDPIYLVNLIAQQQITTLHFVPSMLQAFLETEGLENCKSLKRVICSGEALSIELKERFEARLEVELYNLYGPTEAAVDVTFWNCKQQSNSPTVPIGCPIANTQIYLLDNHLKIVPVGVPGELHIGGIQLALGYLNRPNLTAEKFIPNHLSDQPGDRLYKTGDLARYRPDGSIEFLGRLDDQVKIRGFRIECGEIEVALRRHPKVQQAIVTGREDIPGNKKLVAYVVPKGKPTSSLSNELRRFLKASLPDYMVPTNFMLLETIPLTANGKIDRKALPIPEQTRLDADAVYTAPGTPVEEQLAKIWTELLRIEKVGIYDNFFDLGGHSLLVTQLVVRVKETLQVELTLRSLFEMPTIAKLAENIELLRQPGTAVINTNIFADLKTEAVLDPTIRPDTIPFEYVNEPVNVFLTGVTGFVGSFLLHELLLQTKANVYCLVRSNNVEASKKRIQSSLESYLLWDESQRNRIIPVLGDLSQPLLGLSEKQFQEMASKIDVVYHNGAWVHHTSPYSVLKAANVLGTQEVLRLASKIKLKPVHFISTKSVFSSVGHTGTQIVKEEDNLDDYQVPSDGYSQSKWVAEKLVTIARERGLPVSVYRLGRVSGHSETGVFNQNDFLYKLIIGCVQLGSVPDKDWREDMAPVDYVTRAIIHLSRQEKSLGKAYHFVNPYPFYSSTLINLLHSLGYPLQKISHHQWQTKLFQIAKSCTNHTLYPLLPLLLAKVSPEEYLHSTELQFDAQNTLDGLADTSIVCPPVDEHLLNVYLSYLIRQGFLETTQAKEKAENLSSESRHKI